LSPKWRSVEFALLAVNAKAEANLSENQRKTGCKTP